jgi:hypothetical protein
VIGHGCRPGSRSYSWKWVLHVGQRIRKCTAAVRNAIRAVARELGVWRSGRSGTPSWSDLRRARAERLEACSSGGKTESALSEQEREGSQTD